MKPLLIASALLVGSTGLATAQIDYLGIHLEQQRWNNLQDHQQRMVKGDPAPSKQTEAPALVPDVLDTDFLVIIRQDGTDNLIERTDIVPMIPDKACWLWALQLDDAPPRVAVTEILDLPAPAENWSVQGDAKHTISEDGTQSITRLVLETEDGGWISRAWCVAEADPLGEYSTTIKIGGETVAAFTHSVEAP